MSAFATHAATGALFGLVGVLLVHAYDVRDPAGRGIGWLESFVVVLWAALMALFADLDVVLGEHRATLTNVWVLLALPAFVGTLVLWTPWGREPALRAFVPVLPGAMGSHLVLDTFGFTGREAKVFWPLYDHAYVTPPYTAQHVLGPVRAFDAGSPIFLFVVFMVLFAWVHVVLVERLGDADGPSQWDRFVLAAGSALVALVPILTYRALGLYMPV